MVKPSEPVAMVAYAATWEAELALHLKEIKSTNLGTMFIDAKDIESNMRASRIQLKTRKDPPGGRDIPHHMNSEWPLTIWIVSVLTHPLLDSRVCLRTLTIGIVSGSAPK